jgi:hypothetical protein
VTACAGANHAELNGHAGGVKLITWPYTSLDPVPGAEITSVSSLGNHIAKATCNRYAVVALTADTKSTGCCFQVMAQSAIDKIPPGPKLDALTAEKVFDLRVSLVLGEYQSGYHRGKEE